MHTPLSNTFLSIIALVYKSDIGRTSCQSQPVFDQISHCLQLNSHPQGHSHDMEFGNMGASNKTGLKVGPWGGNGGYTWDDGCHGGVREIVLVYGHCIDSIRIVYDKHGKPVLGDRHGGDGGSFTAQIILKYPEEHLTTICGYHSPLLPGDTPVIRSLWFKTNLRTFGPFGSEEGVPFELPLDGSKVIGFTGRSSCHLNAIGCILSPIRSQNVFSKVHYKLQKKMEDFAVRTHPRNAVSP